MSSHWVEFTRNGILTYYNKTHNSLLLSSPTMDGMMDTLDNMGKHDDFFFDDDPININNAHTEVSKRNRSLSPNDKISLKTIFCPPGKLQLLSSPSGPPIDVIGSETVISLEYNNPVNYAQAKSKKGNEFAMLLLMFPELNGEADVGRGLTIEMIDKIIKHVSNPDTDARCKYYFDFDKLLSQVEGLIFDLFNPRIMDRLEPLPTEDELLESYAKYLFSNYDGDEPADNSGRMAKLKQMFAAINDIGNGVYIITNNDSAARARIRIPQSQSDRERLLFIKLIKILFPEFVEDHLICSQTNTARNKGPVICLINDKTKLGEDIKTLFPKGGKKRTKHNKSKRRYKGLSKHAPTTRKQRNIKRYKSNRWRRR